MGLDQFENQLELLRLFVATWLVPLEGHHNLLDFEIAIQNQALMIDILVRNGK